MARAGVFIDGYNLYHGMLDAEMREWLWVDLRQLAMLLTPDGMTCEEVRYYTAPVKKAGDSREHQLRFLNAHKELYPESEFRIIEGFMQSEPRTCGECQQTDHRWTEKRTDVNLAIDAIAGALVADPQRYDTVILVTGDADQCATVELLVAQGITVICAFPPERSSQHLESCATSAHQISKRQLKRSQLPDIVGTPSGYPILRPDWGPRGAAK